MSMKTITPRPHPFALATALPGKPRIITGHVMDSSGAMWLAGKCAPLIRRPHRRQRRTTTRAVHDPYLVPGTYDLSADFTALRKLERPESRSGERRNST